MTAELLSKFTPSLLSPETLEAIFVQREDLAADLVDSISRATTSKGRHHHLLVGPRGIGKTHLVSIVYHRLMADPKVAKRLRVAWLREESWEVGSFADLLEAMLRALHSEYGDKALADALASLRGVSDDEAERLAERALADWQGDHLLLLIAENLDDIFEGLGDTGQQRFRAWLQNRRSAVVLATTPSLFEGVSKQTGPFFNFFDVTHLDELTLDEATDLLVKIAELRRDTELAEFLRSETGRRRLKVVEALAGGHPRVWILLSECITTELIDELVPLFIKAMDDLTPYYQSRLKELSRQQRQIVTFLVRGRGAFTVKDIAEGTRQSPKVTGVQLKRLQEVGLVREVDLRRFDGRADGRKRYYELREPLLRLSLDVKESRGRPLQLIVDFLRAWYERADLLLRLAELSPSTTLEAEHMRVALGAMTLDVAEAALLDARKRVVAEPEVARHWTELGDLFAATQDNLDPTDDASLNAATELLQPALWAILRRQDEQFEPIARGMAAADLAEGSHPGSVLLGAALTLMVTGVMPIESCKAWLRAWQDATLGMAAYTEVLEMTEAVFQWRATGTNEAVLRLPQESREALFEIVDAAQDLLDLVARGDELPQEVDHGAGEVG